MIATIAGCGVVFVGVVGGCSSEPRQTAWTPRSGAMQAQANNQPSSANQNQGNPTAHSTAHHTAAQPSAPFGRTDRSVSDAVAFSSGMDDRFGAISTASHGNAAVAMVPQRLFADDAAAWYGDLPNIATPAGSPLDGMILDGIDGLQQVTRTSEGAMFDPRMSRDGKFMVFSSTQHRPTADIYMKPVGGSAITQLTADPAHDVMPSISPDGSRIAFASNRNGNWDIFVMSSRGGQAVQITSGPEHELHPSWSPDGSRLVFCRLGEMSRRWELWTVAVDSPSTMEFIGYGLFPEWSPVAGTGTDGRDKILFQRSRERGSRSFSVWTIDYTPGDTSAPTQVVSLPQAAAINPSWSHDGKWIVYSVVPAAMSTTATAGRPIQSDVWMTDTMGGARVNLTAGQFVNLMPTWGTDNRIYFVSNRDGADNIWSMGTSKAIAAITGSTPGNTRGTDSGFATVPTTP